jgi:hypothetical protein
MRIARSDDGGARLTQPQLADSEIIAATGLFAEPVRRTHERRLVRPADVVVGVENTRATSLSWPDEVRRDFTGDLRRLLRSQTEVHLTQHTSLTMAQLAPRR